MAILVKKCQRCGKRYQHYKGAAIPEDNLCSVCLNGAIVMYLDDEDEDSPRL